MCSTLQKTLEISNSFGLLEICPSPRRFVRTPSLSQCGWHELQGFQATTFWSDASRMPEERPRRDLCISDSNKPKRQASDGTSKAGNKPLYRQCVSRIRESVTSICVPGRARISSRTLCKNDSCGLTFSFGRNVVSCHYKSVNQSNTKREIVKK